MTLKQRAWVIAIAVRCRAVIPASIRGQQGRNLKGFINKDKKTGKSVFMTVKELCQQIEKNFAKSK